MTINNLSPLNFATVKNRYIEADFNGGNISSDGGALLLRQIDRKLGLLQQASTLLKDPRKNKAQCTHSFLSLLRQQVYALALGYEDLNDHDFLRDDIIFQSAVGRDETLASSSTLCRLQNGFERDSALALNQLLVDQFLASFSSPPKELILDFDATDDPTHGNQEKVFFHGYYRHYCFLPLYVFCGNALLCAYLRPSNIDGAKHTGPILKYLVERIRQKWPDCNIIFRGDGGFCRKPLLHWCERHGVDYIIGIAKNKRLEKETLEIRGRAEKTYQETQEKVRYFQQFQYASGSWNQERTIICKAEHLSKGANPRYIVTTLSGSGKHLYEDLYCARGDMENRIKEQQLDLFADRTSAHNWWANQFRMLLSALAYTLLNGIREIGAEGTDLAKAYTGTIRLKLLKIGAVVTRNTRKVKVHLSSIFPYQKLFQTIHYKINTS